MERLGEKLRNKAENRNKKKINKIAIKRAEP